MKEYHVIRTHAVPDWAQVGKMPVAECPWGGEYRPEIYGQVAYQEGLGFHVRMTCKETAPRAVYTHPDDMVCQDSCMEFFADFAPEAGKGYLNFEANANGTLLLGLGDGRHGRARVREMGCPLPQLVAFREGEYWGWQAFIPLTMIEAIYGKTAFAPGDVIRANLYKCGDKTDTVHYVVWNPVVALGPDYHRPECFGKLIVD